MYRDTEERTTCCITMILNLAASLYQITWSIVCALNKLLQCRIKLLMLQCLRSLELDSHLPTFLPISCLVIFSHVIPQCFPSFSSLSTFLQLSVLQLYFYFPFLHSSFDHSTYVFPPSFTAMFSHHPYSCPDVSPSSFVFISSRYPTMLPPSDPLLSHDVPSFSSPVIP